MREQIVPFANMKQRGKFSYVVEQDGQKIKRHYEYDRKKLSEVILDIVRSFARQGFTPTLRQVYYQIIGKDLLPNCLPAYEAVGGISKYLREHGFMDWSYMEDRTRTYKKRYTEDNVEDAINRTFESYRLDLQRTQKTLIIVMSEKDAISEIVRKACYPYSGVYHINRGYCSVDAIYRTYEKVVTHLNKGREYKAKIIYCGDHDPSGCQMGDDVYNRVLMALCHGNQYDLHEDETVQYSRTYGRTDSRTEAYEHARDMFDWASDDEELKEFADKGFIAWDKDGEYPPYIDRKKKRSEYSLYYIDNPGIIYADIDLNERFEVVRAFLNMDQIEALSLPPNFAKQTDSRFDSYVEQYNTKKSWELDALTPDFIIETLTNHFEEILDMEEVIRLRSQEKKERELVSKLKEIEEGKIEVVSEIASRGKSDLLENVAKVLRQGGGIDLNKILTSYLDEIQND